MPYSNVSELPEDVKGAIPSDEGKEIFMSAFNSAYADNQDESSAFQIAWTALKNAGYEKNEEGVWVSKTLPSPSSVHVPSTGRKKPKANKRYVNDDVYTRPEEAEARSHDIGLEGKIHVYTSTDGQAVYMPGSSHEEYLEVMGKPADVQDTSITYEGNDKMGMIQTLVHAIVSAFMGYKEPVSKSTMYAATSAILKIDEEQRMVYGWASVITEDGKPVVDTQGDVISPEEMVKAANAFMTDVRVGKVMHSGRKIGEFVHSLPLTKDLAKALGIDTNREGWIVGMKVHDDEAWEGVKSGKYAGLSIGGRAIREMANG